MIRTFNDKIIKFNITKYNTDQEYYKNLLLEATMLYASLMVIDQSCQITNKELNSIVTSIDRLLVKVECGMCKNC